MEIGTERLTWIGIDEPGFLGHVLVERDGVDLRDECHAPIVTADRHADIGDDEGFVRRVVSTTVLGFLLLASERLVEEETADAVTVFAYQLLLGLLPADGPRPEVLVELLEEENRVLFDGEEADIVVSPTLVGHLLSQVALRRELAALFAELSRPRGAQLVLRPARAYPGTHEALTFADVEDAAGAHGEIALGIRRGAGPEAGVALDPERHGSWVPAPEDDVLVLASHRGGSEAA